jgi:hypothetical protein
LFLLNCEGLFGFLDVNVKLWGCILPKNWTAFFVFGGKNLITGIKMFLSLMSGRGKERSVLCPRPSGPRVVVAAVLWGGPGGRVGSACYCVAHLTYCGSTTYPDSQKKIPKKKYTNIWTFGNLKR